MTIQESFTTGGKDHIYGRNDLEAIFPNQRPTGGVPWPAAGRRKDRQSFDPEVVRSALEKSPPDLSDIDPRSLRSSQSSITRAGVEHYMSDEHRETGRLFADQSQRGNQYPLVYTRGDQHVLLSGHHRAAAALLQGRQLRAIHVEGDWGPER